MSWYQTKVARAIWRQSKDAIAEAKALGVPFTPHDMRPQVAKS